MIRIISQQFQTIIALCCVLSSVHPFSSPFGVTVRKNNVGGAGPQQVVMVPVTNNNVVCPAYTTTLTSSASSSLCLFMAKKKKGDADDDDDNWEPSSEDEMLADIEDLQGIDEEDVVIVADELVVVDDDDDDDEVVEDTEDAAEVDDDDDEIEVDDIWEEDDDDEELGLVDKPVEAYLGGESDPEEYGDDYEGNEEEEFIPLQDDPEDPNYMAQKKLVEETIARRDQLKADKDFDEVDFLLNTEFSQEELDHLENNPFTQEVEKLANEMFCIDEDDFKGKNLEEELGKTGDIVYDDPYENLGDDNILNTGVSDDLVEKLDGAFKSIEKTLQEEPWDKVMVKAESTNLDSLDNETLTEMDACLEEIGGSAYNCTRWLLYDLDFNVSNLMLAAVKHNPQAPILFQHWFPQLQTYRRYKHARDRTFDFNWDDVENADIGELERYYQGFGYDEIPDKAPAETGIISFEDVDDEEMKMAAFEQWMIDVYNPELDRKDFDDDEFRDTDNVFSEFYEEPDHPDLPTFEDAADDLREWDEEMGDDPKDKKYKEYMGRMHQYEYKPDPEFTKEFRGHLIVACTPMDEDLEIAEKITAVMKKNFGKQIYTETRVMAHAREEDFVFEVWLESYEIDLLHSKKRATSNDEGWKGPAECDDKQIDYLVDQVGFLISDEFRYSYRFEEMEV